MILKEALKSFDEKDTDYRLYAMWGHSLKIPRCFKLFSHFLGDIIDSCPLVQEVPTIIMPDFPVNSIKHLINLLTKGFTQSQDDQDVKDIIEVAKVLNIDLKNLVYDEQTKQAEPTKFDELEEGEIEDEEGLLLMAQEPKLIIVKKIGIKIASFAKASSSDPNIMTNDKSNVLFRCPECKKSFGSETALETHLKMTCKHGNEEVKLLMAQEPKQRFVNKIGIQNINFQCPECKKCLGTETGLESHLKMKHGHIGHGKSKKMPRCRLCCQVFNSTSDLLSHKEIHKICEICGQVSRSISCMVGHIRSVHGFKPYKCNLCHFAASQRAELKIHVKKQHKIDI